MHGNEKANRTVVVLMINLNNQIFVDNLLVISLVKVSPANC